jgi:hypothetical protein
MDARCGYKSIDDGVSPPPSIVIQRQTSLVPKVGASVFLSKVWPAFRQSRRRWGPRGLLGHADHGTIGAALDYGRLVISFFDDEIRRLLDLEILYPWIVRRQAHERDRVVGLAIRIGAARIHESWHELPSLLGTESVGRREGVLLRR